MSVPQPRWPKLPNGPFMLNGFPLVEFDRRPLDRAVLRGFALGWSSHLTLVHLLDCGNYQLNGYAAFLNADVRNWRDVPKDDLLARAVRLRRLRPHKPEGVSLASVRELLTTAGTHSPPGAH